MAAYHSESPDGQADSSKVEAVDRMSCNVGGFSCRRLEPHIGNTIRLGP